MNILDKFKKETSILLAGIGISRAREVIIGLDIGLKDVRAAKIIKVAGAFSSRGNLVKGIEHIKEVSKDFEMGIDDKVCINFNSEAVAIRRLRIPLMPREEIEEALKWHLKDQIQFDINNAKIKFEILGEKEDKSGSKSLDAIALLYKEEDIEKAVLENRKLGFNVRGVFATEVALTEYAVTEGIMPKEDGVAIVDIGWKKSSISIVENGKLTFARTIAIGGDSITDAMTAVLMSAQGRLEVSRDEAEQIKCEKGLLADSQFFSMMRPVLERLSNELKRSLEYYSQRYNSILIKKLILAGNGAKLKGLKEYLLKEADFDVVGELPEDACSIGLALASNSELNMIPKKFLEEHTKEVKRISIRMLLFVGVLLFVFSYIVVAFKSANLRNELRSLNSHWNAIKEVKSLKDNIMLYTQALNTVSGNKLDTGTIMKSLSNIIPPYVVLEGMIIRATEPNVNLSGVILIEERLGEFMNDLERSGEFSKVQLVSSERSMKYPKDAIDFAITCNVVK